MEEFNLEKVINEFEAFRNSGNFTQNVTIFLLKTTKNKTDIYKQEGNDETKKILIDSILENIQTANFKNREIIKYDAVNSKKNTHEIVTVSEYDNIENMLSKFNDENQHLINTSDLNETNFQFWLASINYNEHTYKVIGNFSNILELQKKFLFGNFNDTRIDFSNKNNVFGFNKKIEILITDDEYMLLNQAETKFENIFKMHKLFSSEATKILQENKEIQKIFDEKTRKRLIDKVKNGKRMATRLIKIVADSDTFTKTINRISKIKEITDNPNHKFYNQVKDVKFENNQLFVEEGEEVQLINSISDAFVKAFISETERVDETRM